jgi:hypothetical protein
LNIRNPWLAVAGGLCACAALLHVGVTIGGPTWYRTFGAGEAMADAAQRGDPRPPIITLLIAAVLGLWAAYGFAGASLIRRLPLMRTALTLITAIFLLRGLLLVPMLALNPQRVTAFDVWSSLAVLAIGASYAIGLVRGWSDLGRRT